MLCNASHENKAILTILLHSALHPCRMRLPDPLHCLSRVCPPSMVRESKRSGQTGLFVSPPSSKKSPARVRAGYDDTIQLPLLKQKGCQWSTLPHALTNRS